MSSLRSLVRRCGRLLALAIIVSATHGCTPPPERRVSEILVAGVPRPEFDPQGPPDPLRESLERALARGLTDVTEGGVVIPDLAEGWAWSADRCTLRFTLREGLRYPDDSLVTASHVRDALLAGLERTDHRRSAHLLAAVRGVGASRGRTRPPVGIEAPDARTLELTLTQPDSLLPLKLALAGISAPWRNLAGGWEGASGCGPYRLAARAGGTSLRLVRRETPLPSVATVDTLEVRFVPSAPRVRDLMRDAVPDAVWPLPPALLDADAPSGYRRLQVRPIPERRLVLVLRADRPPLNRLDRRLKLARVAESRSLLTRLGRTGAPVGEWVEGGGAASPVRVAPTEPATATRPRSSGGPAVPGSFHFRLAFDVDGAAARVAEALVERWAEEGIYVDREPIRRSRLALEALARSGPQALLVVVQPLLTGPAEAIAPYAESPAGVPLAGFRTGWRPRDLVPVFQGRESLGPAEARERLEEERVAIPIARLDWARMERGGGGGARSHPRFGLEYTELREPTEPRTRH